MKKKVERAIKLIQSASKIAAENGRQEIEVSYSTGKDSDVILELTKMACVPYRAVYKNTTIDTPGSIKHAKENCVEIIQPTKNFAQLIQENGLPSRFRRFCCSFLKEYATSPYSILGIRREESSGRAKRYHEPEQCRVYRDKSKTRQYFPILDWTEQDVLDFVKERGIKLHKHYYNENGEIDVTRRVGCVCCPLMSKRKRLESFRRYPNMVKFYARNLKKYYEGHPTSKSVIDHHSDIYECLVHDFFFADNQQRWREINYNSFLPPPITKNFLKTTSV